MCSRKNLGNNLRFSKEIVNKKLIEDNRSIRLIGNYVSARIPTDFSCLKCNHVWKTSPDNVCRGGTGCPMCCDRNADRKISRDEAELRINKRVPTIKMIGEYHGFSEKTVFECVTCSYTWTTSPKKITYHTGCPNCASYGFVVNKTTYAYIIEFDNFIKYGITNSPNTRFDKHRRQGMINIIECREYVDGYLAQRWEKLVKTTVGGNFVTRDILFDGFTETLPKNVIDTVRRLMPPTSIS
jgi:Zn finger protein HypA/HybF involved in hydrogenase expression